MEKDFEQYGFIMTDRSIGEMDHDEYYFEISDENKLQQFMADHNVLIEQFDTSDADENDTFEGLDFQLSVYGTNDFNLEYGPVFCCSETEEYTTVSVKECKIKDLDSYLYAMAMNTTKQQKE